jgi:hypothetical protein
VFAGGVGAVEGEATNPEDVVRRTEIAKRLATDVEFRGQIVSEYASDVLSELSEESHIPEATTDVFNLESFNPSETRLQQYADWEGTASTDLTRDDGKVTLFMASLYQGDTHIRLFVQPELDRSYALVADGEEEEVTQVRGNLDEPRNMDVSTESCSDYSSCTDDLCWGCGYETGCEGYYDEEFFDCQYSGYCACYSEGTECTKNCFWDCGC